MNLPTLPIASVLNRTIPGPGGDLPLRIYTPNGNGPFPLRVFLDNACYKCDTATSRCRGGSKHCRPSSGVLQNSRVGVYSLVIDPPIYLCWYSHYGNTFKMPNPYVSFPLRAFLLFVLNR